MLRHQSRLAVAACVFAALLLAVVLSDCTSAASAPAGVVSVTVRPPVSLADQPIHIRVSGLVPGEQATVLLRSTDAQGVGWRASATYRADASGDIDLSRARATSGSYLGVSGMGLIWSMRPTGPDPAGAYFWNNATRLTFTVAVTVHGTKVGSASFQRQFSRGALADQTESLQPDGFVGEFWHPVSTAARRPAILVLGGSEGGLPGVLLPALLASNGYPALGVAYFKEPGLPTTLSRIPLEYFARALRWLARQPGVDPTRIAVLGVSRGSEAAQLLGAYYPGLVHAVIASVPSNVALCSYPGCTGPAWTLHGRPLPYTSEFDNPSPADDPAAVIPDQRIQGPVFLDCGEADQTWTSCPFAQAILSLLDAHHDHWSHVLYAYAGAGHFVGSLVPYEPLAPASAGSDPSYAADQEADALLWPHLLRFLGGLAQE
jgi:dienelactone hydrolase